MMKKQIKLSGLVLGVILMSSFQLRWTVGAQELFKAELGGDPCAIENTTFQVGEKIVYKIYYNLNFIWLAAGEVVFEVKDNEDQYHITAKGRTYSTYEWFFKVRDSYETYIDKETLLPQMSIRDVQEGKYKLYEKVIFDHDNNKAVTYRKKYDDPLETTTVDIESCMHDIISILYFTRNIEFKSLSEGAQFPVKLFMDKDTYPLNVEYKGEERKRVKGKGKLNTYRFSPEVIAGEVFDEDTRMDIWVSRDENQIPLMIESPVSVGSVKAVLKEHSGLRHNLNIK